MVSFQQRMEEESLVILGSPHKEFCTGSLVDFIQHQMTLHGNKISQVDGISTGSKTFAELLKEAKVLAGSVLELGVLKGDTIAISCENRFEYSVVMLASLFNGTVFAPINPTYSPDEILHVLNISKPKIIFCSGYTLKNMSVSVPKLKGVIKLILLDNMNFHSSLPILKYSSLFETKQTSMAHSSGFLRRDDDIAVILTSSGTTGLPKGVMLSYGNVKYFCNISVNCKFMNFRSDDKVLGLLPLYHGYGFGLLLTTFLVGIQLILLPKFEEKLVLSTIQKFKITNLHLVPPLMTFMAKHPLVMKYDLTSVREVICGAAPLSTETIQEVKARLPRVDIRQGYGMTELSILITITPPHVSKPNSVGLLAPGLQAKVLNIETGEPVVRGKVGEIVVRGPSVMVGYCNDPEATRNMIDSEGWLSTGDVGYVDHEGYFYIIDRIKELIKYNGYQVAPAELESLLLGIPGIRDAAVIGLPDASCGELPVAFVVLQPNATLTESNIIDYIKGKVSPQKRLRGVRFVQSVPRSPSGKILRRTLRQSLTSKL